MTTADSKLESLARILRQEKAADFQDTTVIGGLDLFLQRWTAELKPALGEFSSYSVLTPPQREKWVDGALAKIGPGAADDAPRRPLRHRHPQAGARTLALDTTVDRLRGASPNTLRLLRRLGTETVGDLIYLFPHRHNDFGNVCKVSELQPGQDQTVIVSVWEASESRRGPRRRSTQAVLGDETGNVRAIWFNNPYLVKTLGPGTQLVISGRVGLFRGQPVFESPEYELLQGQEQLVHTGRLVPVYPSVERLPQRTLRRMVKQALDAGIGRVEEFLPADLLDRTRLQGLQAAIAQAHYPDTMQDWAVARRRLGFDELFLMQVAVLRRKRAWQEDAGGIPLDARDTPLDGFLASLPFRLTGAQRRSLDEILGDLGQDRPMSRLLQGDVGSGKTVVATAVMLLAAFRGYQAMLMVPTEILAEQHFSTISRLASAAPESREEEHIAAVAVDGASSPINIGLLLGSMAKKTKRAVHEAITAGEVDVLIGTHTLLQSGVEVPNLALVVVDEQHRFGVMQRATLREKGRRPHLLAMSATPIPRSLALTMYGDLDISAIDELPPGRRRIRTRWVEPERRAAAYEFIRREVASGRQAFIVFPLIDESEAVHARAANEEYQRLSADVFPDLRLGLLHGRMALREREPVMERFQGGDLDVLLSTAVVEVGIDVPNATVMLIDGADRFGLAQLHQFRGRVGRGEHQGYCLLLSDSPGAEARERLKILERVDDGFQLAEEDLRLRGPGDYLGTRQSGLPDLRVASITDLDLLALARREATRVLDADPELSAGENSLLAERISRYEAGIAADLS